MPIYEFTCKCGNVFERICELGTVKTQCMKCSRFAPKVLSASNFKVNGYNAKNGYHRTEKQQFIKDGINNAEKRQKKDGKQTAADILL